MAKYTYPQDFQNTFWTVLDGDFYVSTLGNDITGDGSPLRPYFTVNKAMELANNGEKVVIGPDEYVQINESNAVQSTSALEACRLAATSNVTLLTGGRFTIDGTFTEVGDRVLLWNQNDPTENGIYLVSLTPWQRAEDFNSAENIKAGALIPIFDGISQANTVFQFTTNEEIEIGTTNLVFQKVVSDGVAWGKIEGDITEQSDLVGAFSSKANISNVLELDNSTAYAPSADYHPATRKFVLDQLEGLPAIFDKATPKGLLDCSASPIYPSAELGDYYYVPVDGAGKIGGTSGVSVQIGDKIQCIADSVEGEQSAVGDNWIIFQGNLDKATIVEAQGGTDDEKYLTSQKAAAGWESWVNSRTIAALNTVNDTIIGAINELQSTSASITNGSGTTANGSAVDLGGTVTGDVNINLNNNSFTLQTSNGETALQVSTNENRAFMYFTNGSGTNFNVNESISINTPYGLGSELNFSGDNVRLWAGGGDPSDYLQIGISDIGYLWARENEGFEFVDGRTTRVGIEYREDYSDNFSDRSLVDKAYVDAEIASAVSSSTGNDDPSVKLYPTSEYDSVYFVNDVLGDDTTAAPDSNSLYMTITAAVEAARADYDVNQRRNIIYVQAGTYNEKSIVRNHVDMFFEDGAVVWTEGSGNSVINDIPEVMDGVNILGKGTFVSKDTNPYDDREGINIRRASQMTIEAKLVDNIQIWNLDTVSIEFRDLDIILGLSIHNNKTINLINCRFLNGYRVSSYRGDNTKMFYEGCEFILPPYHYSDPLNLSMVINDKDGNEIFIIVPPTSDYHVDFTDKTNDQVIEETFSIFTSGGTVVNPFISCFMYSQNDYFFNIGSIKVEVRNCTMRIQKEGGCGILLAKRRNSATTEGHVLFDDVLIIDETLNKDTTALVTGWGDQATRQVDFMLNAISSNCGTDQKLLDASLNPWTPTYRNIGAAADTSSRYHDVFLETGSPSSQYAVFKAGSSISIVSSLDLSELTFERWNGTAFELPHTTLEDLNSDLFSQNEGSYHRFRISANVSVALASLTLKEVFGLVQIDTLAPTYLVGPMSNAITASTFEIYTQLNENGTVYVKLMGTGDPEPDGETIVTDSDYSSNDTGAGVTFNFTELSETTEYKAYLVAEDVNGNIGDVDVLSITTSSNIGNVTGLTYSNNNQESNIGEVGQVFSPSPDTDGGSGNLTYSVIAGIMPAFLTLNTDTGEIVWGANGELGSYQFTVQVEGSDGLVGTASYVVELNVVAPPISVEDIYLNNSKVNSAFYEVELNVQGTVYAIAALAGSIPEPSVLDVISANQFAGSTNTNLVADLNITGLNGDTTYDIYFAVEDNFGNAIESVTKLSLTTRDPQDIYINLAPFWVDVPQNNTSGHPADYWNKWNTTTFLEPSRVLEDLVDASNNATGILVENMSSWTGRNDGTHTAWLDIPYDNGDSVYVMGKAMHTSIYNNTDEYVEIRFDVHQYPDWQDKVFKIMGMGLRRYKDSICEVSTDDFVTQIEEYQVGYRVDPALVDFSTLTQDFLFTIENSFVDIHGFISLKIRRKTINDEIYLSWMKMEISD